MSFLPPAQAPMAAQTPGPLHDTPSDPSSYIRDPHKLVAYIVPFPRPHLPSGSPEPPLRFIIYTPPPPPLLKPGEGEKEHLTHKVQRKWQEEVREAKESSAKVTSWKGIKGRVTKGISWAVDRTTTADLDFVTRIPKDGSDEGGHGAEGETTKRTVKLDEIVLVYPPSIHMSPEQLRAEFVNNLMRTKSKAEKDAIIATGLLPVAAAADFALMFVGWIFGGLLEVDGVWAAASIRGAKISRSISKRLASSTKSGDLDSSADTLHLNFVESPRVAVLESYLDGRCSERNTALFGADQPGSRPSEEDVLEAIGWTPSPRYEEKNWEDEAWERRNVGEDVKETLGKAAKAWEAWVKLYEKDPKKAAKR